eukprot:g5338.t1
MLHCKTPVGGKGKLMISEHYETDTRKVTVWDLDKDEITNEMGFKIPTDESADNHNGTQGEGNNFIETICPSTTAEGFSNRLNQDWYPSICISKDERWVTEFSWTHQSCIICSVESSVPVWKLCFSEMWKTCDTLRPSSLAFDQEEHYLMVFTDTSIFAFAPLLLNTDSRPKETRKESMPKGPWKVDYCQEYKHLLEDICGIPSAAISQLLPPKLSKSKNWFNSVSNPYFGEIQRVTDCAYMRTDQSFVCIANSTEGNSGVFYFKRFCELYKRYHLQLSEDVYGTPRRLFSYNAGNKIDGLVIVYEDLNPVAVFCEVHPHKSTGSGYELMVEEKMPLEKCHSLSQSIDGTQLLFVSGTSVKILDLKSREIREVRYRIKFDDAFNHGRNSSYLKNLQAEEWWQNCSRRVSDDGKSVLLGWDTTNQTSIVISPDTEETDYQRAIQDSDAKLSQFCSLSCEGQLTIYVHNDASKEGHVSLALFDETSEPIKRCAFSYQCNIGKRTTWKLDMKSLFPKGYKVNDVERLMSEVTYGLSKDGSNLIIINHGVEKESKDAEILTIGLVCGTGLFPCVVEKQSIENDQNPPLKKLISKYGSHVLNLTTTSMTTVVQDALSNAYRPTIEYIKNFAKNSNVKIGLDWISSEEKYTNYLEKSLKGKDKTKVEMAMEMIGSEVTPFVSSANAVGNSFGVLLNEHQDTIHKALKKNHLVTTEAEFDVHVGFLDADERENKSVHIRTVDEYYDWSSEIVNENKMAENWEAMNKKAVEDFKLSENFSMTRAKLKFVRIANAAKMFTDIGGSLSVFATLIIVAYISAAVIVLLNLLIAIMGDTFDRVKCTENSQLLLARARFIDACEAELTNREIEKINKKTGKYVCAIFPDEEKEYHHKHQWLGKLSRIDQGIKREIKTATCDLGKMMREDKDTMSSHFDKRLEENNSLLKNIEKTVLNFQNQLRYITKDKSDMFLQENRQSEECQALDLTSNIASESNLPCLDNASIPEAQNDVLSTNIVQSLELEPIQVCFSMWPPNNDFSKMAINAIKNDDDIILEEALVEGINPDDKHAELHKDFNEEGLTLLQLCAICNSIRCAKVLMKCNASRDVNTSSECSLLHLCGTYNSFALAQMLLDNDADKNFSNNVGVTPLHEACEVGNLVIVKTLMKRNVEVNYIDENKQAPLHKAIEHGHYDVVKELIARGANVDLQENTGASPLYIASATNSIDVAKELIAHGANIDLQNKNGASPLYIASYNNSIDVAKELIAHGANIELQEKDGRSPLYIASAYNSIHIAKELIAHGANIDLQRKDGCSPLYTASKMNSIDVAKELIAHGANIDLQQKDGRSPLYIASQRNSIDVAKELIAHGANIDLQQKDGWTPLHIASSFGRINIVKILIENGTDKKTSDIEGKTPFDVAYSNVTFTTSKGNSLEEIKTLLKH